MNSTENQDTKKTPPLGQKAENAEFKKRKLYFDEKTLFRATACLLACLLAGWLAGAVLMSFVQASKERRHKPSDGSGAAIDRKAGCTWVVFIVISGGGNEFQTVRII